MAMDIYASDVVMNYIELEAYNVSEEKDLYLTQGYHVFNGNDENRRTYFLFENDVCIGELDVTFIDNQYASSFMFYENLYITEAYANNEAIALVADTETLMLFTEEQNCPLYGDNLIEIDGICGYANVDSEVDNEFEAEEIFLSRVSKTEESEQTNIILRVADDISLNVPIVRNTVHPVSGDGLCWAASISSIGAYRTGDSPLGALELCNELQELYNSVEIPTGYTTWEYRAFQYYGLSPTEKSGGMSFSSTASVLRQDKPIYAAITDGNSHYHGVTICGYRCDSGTNYYYKIMDPNKPTFSYSNVLSTTSNNFTFVGSNYTYTRWRYAMY